MAAMPYRSFGTNTTRKPLLANETPRPLAEYEPEHIPGTPKSTTSYKPTPKHNLPAGPYYTPPRHGHDTHEHRHNTRPYPPTEYQSPRTPSSVQTPPGRSHSRTPVYTPQRPRPSTNTIDDLQRRMENRFESLRNEMGQMMNEFCDNIRRGSRDMGPHSK